MVASPLRMTAPRCTDPCVVGSADPTVAAKHAKAEFAPSGLKESWPWSVFVPESVHTPTAIAGCACVPVVLLSSSRTIAVAAEVRADPDVTRSARMLPAVKLADSTLAHRSSALVTRPNGNAAMVIAGGRIGPSSQFAA